MLLICVGSVLIIQTYCMPISNKEHVKQKSSVGGLELINNNNTVSTTDSRSSKRQYEVDCTDTTCSWVNKPKHHHHTHYNDCGIDAHAIHDHGHHSRCGCGIHTFPLHNNCWRYDCNPHDHHGYCNQHEPHGDQGDHGDNGYHGGNHAPHNLDQDCEHACESHSAHDEIGSNAIRYLERDFPASNSPVAVHHLYVHDQPRFDNHHVVHSLSHAAPGIQHKKCRVWQDDGCVEYLNQFSDRNTHIKPPAVHVYGHLHHGLTDVYGHVHHGLMDASSGRQADGTLARTGVPANSSVQHMYSDGIPIVATAPPKNPSPVDVEEGELLPSHARPIASTQASVFPVQAHKDPMEAQLECFEPTDADILPAEIEEEETDKKLTGLSTHINLDPSHLGAAATDPTHGKVPAHGKVAVVHTDVKTYHTSVEIPVEGSVVSTHEKIELSDIADIAHHIDSQ